jgi:hypothetical protein
MDSLERLLLYRKKLILPRIYQVINWFMWITYFCAILFLATLVYEHGFMISSDEAKAIRIIYKSVCCRLQCRLFFNQMRTDRKIHFGHG